MAAIATTARVPLGRSGLSVSPLGIGTWAWGDRLWGYGRSYGDDELRPWWPPSSCPSRGG